MSNIIFFSLVAFTLYIVIVALISLKMANRAKEIATSDVRQNIAIPVEGRKLDLELLINTDEADGNTSVETVIKNPAPGVIYSYAFYLVVDGERTSARWHETSPKFEFLLPEKGNKKEIVAFVKDDQNHTTSIKKII